MLSDEDVASLHPKSECVIVDVVYTYNCNDSVLRIVMVVQRHLSKMRFKQQPLSGGA